MSSWKRTVECGLVTDTFLGKEVVLNGWVATRRDHGGLIFVDLRDRTGVVQVVFNPEFSKEIHDLAHMLRSEYVISVYGKVVKRSADTINEKMPTGKIEVRAHKLIILNKAKTIPFQLDEKVDEELRLKFRYLDLRRPIMQRRIALRSALMYTVREFFIKRGFFEIETPMLTKNSPEGAREFLVPSRLHHGFCYALPQSPQLYKQLLMASGMERYFQIARCFRDEDLRADRQPEFTQLDVEMSFIDESDIQSLVEDMFVNIFKKMYDLDIKVPFPVFTYDQAFSLYGTDAPDIRFAMQIYDATSLFKETELSFLKTILKKDGRVGGLCISDKKFTRSELDSWVKKTKELGAKGLLYVHFLEDGTIESPVSNFLPKNFFEQAKGIFKDLSKGSTLFFVAGNYKLSWHILGKLRLALAQKYGFIKQHVLALCWVTRFPLFEWSEADRCWNSVNHPFTAPEADWNKKEIEKIYARAYDVVCNGTEIGGGSIRIHTKEIQEKVFEILGLTQQEMQEKFGFLLQAQEYGFPPHGGIAFGLDRFLMILLNTESIREVIAFPKTQKGYDPMMAAPSCIDTHLLKDCGLKEIGQHKQKDEKKANESVKK